MIAGAISIDLTVEPTFPAYREDRWALEVLPTIPDGVRVVVDIGDRAFVSQDAAKWLHQHADRLLIEIIGKHPDAVATFVRAARAGEWSAVV